jgi:hypothetical protein
MLGGDYLIKISLTEGSASYPYFIPTYFGDHVSWEVAQLISLEESIYDKHVHLVPVAPLPAGPGNIDGIISIQGNEPLAGQQVDIILSDESNHPLLYSATTPDGAFGFNDLPMGTYLLKADLAGRPSETQVITLSSSNPTVSMVQLTIFESAFFGLEETDTFPFNSLHIFPNPVKDLLNIELEPKNAGIASIAVLDITGRTHYLDEYLLKKGEQTIRIRTTHLPAGIYLLRIHYSGFNVPVSRKFIK